MTMHTTGWAEVPDPLWFAPGTPEWVEHGAKWEAVLYLLPLITWYMAERGVYADWAVINARMHHDLPDDVSERVRQDYERDHTTRQGVTVPKWTTWEVWQTLPWNQPFLSELTILHDILAMLGSTYGDGNVRIIWWSFV